MNRLQATPEEERWIRRFALTIKAMPDTVWLLAAAGFIHTMRKDDQGVQVWDDFGEPDQSYIIGSVRADIDGTGW